MKSLFKKILYRLAGEKQSDLSILADDLERCIKRDIDLNRMVLGTKNHSGYSRSLTTLCLVVENLANALESNMGFKRFQREYYKGRCIVDFDRWLDTIDLKPLSLLAKNLRRIDRIFYDEDLERSLLYALVSEITDLIKLIDELPDRSSR